jgi:FkbM family methyltransferase
MKLMHKIGVALHSLLAKSPLASMLYFRVLARLLPLCGRGFRMRYLNNFRHVIWPSLALPPQRVRFGKGVTFLIHPHLDEDDCAVLGERVWPFESEVYALVEKLVLEVDTIIEIGANVGAYTAFFATAPGAGQRRLFSFEPSRKAFKRLLENLDANGLLNSVEVFCCAVGQQTGIATFFEPEGHLSNGSLLPEFAGLFTSRVARHEVLMVGGDVIAGLAGDRGRLLIKMDAEGFEAKILLGLEPLIRRLRPIIILEVLPLYCAELNALSFLWECGYRRLEIRPEGLVEREQLIGGKYRDYLLAVDGIPAVAALLSPGAVSHRGPGLVSNDRPAGQVPAS